MAEMESWLKISPGNELMQDWFYKILNSPILTLKLL